MGSENDFLIRVYATALASASQTLSEHSAAADSARRRLENTIREIQRFEKEEPELLSQCLLLIAKLREQGAAESELAQAEEDISRRFTINSECIIWAIENPEWREKARERRERATSGTVD